MENRPKQARIIKTDHGYVVRGSAFGEISGVNAMTGLKRFKDEYFYLQPDGWWTKKEWEAIVPTKGRAMQLLFNYGYKKEPGWSGIWTQVPAAEFRKHKDSQ